MRFLQRSWISTVPLAKLSGETLLRPEHNCVLNISGGGGGGGAREMLVKCPYFFMLITSHGPRRAESKAGVCMRLSVTATFFDDFYG